MGFENVNSHNPADKYESKSCYIHLNMLYAQLQTPPAAVDKHPACHDQVTRKKNDVATVEQTLKLMQELHCLQREATVGISSLQSSYFAQAKADLGSMKAAIMTAQTVKGIRKQVRMANRGCQMKTPLFVDLHN